MGFHQNVKHAKRKASKKVIAEKLRRQKTVWEKFMDSERHMTMLLSYCGLFLLYGMSDELLGPTLIELSCLVAKPLKSMSWLFFSHDLGLLLGTLCGGIIVSRVDKNLTITICLVANALCMTIIPVLHRFSSVMSFVLLYGLFLGTPDTLTNVMLIKVFGKEVAPYLQGVHFFYGFGAFLSPLVARPFLRETCSYEINVTDYYNVKPKKLQNVTYDNKTGLWSSRSVFHQNDNESDVMYAYWMAALLHVPVILGLSWLYFKKYLDYQKGIFRESFVSLHEDDELPVNSIEMVPFNPDLSFWERIRKNAQKRLLAVTILCSVLMFLYEGLMAMYGGYAYSFAVKGVASMTSDQGAYLTSLYWGFFSLGRFFCIIVAFFVTPKSMLMANVLGCFLSALVLVSGHTNIRAVFVGTCMLGFSLSSTAPTIISMAEQYVDLTAQTTSTLVISSAFGELFMPVIVGQVFERIGPSVVPGTVFMICFLGFVCFCLLLTFDNDRAYEHASSAWRIVKNFLCFGCESEKQRKYGRYRNLSQYSSFSNSDSSESGFLTPNEELAPKADIIPKPVVTTNVVQPQEMDFINEDEIVGEVVYGDNNTIEIKEILGKEKHNEER